jgi:hypothetical protein
MFTLNDQVTESTKDQDRELVNHLYRVLLDLQNDPEVSTLNQDHLIRKAQADYAAAEEWYAGKHNVNMEVE